jgi:hypothetical protein
VSRLRVWCAGASIGYLVGWLAGSNVLKMAEGRRLGRPEPRTALPAPVESPEPLIGRENGVQRCGLLDPIGRNRCSLPRDHEGLHRNPDAHDVPWPTPTRWVDLFGIDPDYTGGLSTDEFIERNRAGADPLPTQRADEPCTRTLGVLTCPFTGPHTAHAYQSGTCGPDRKSDTDEGIE